MNNMKMQKDMTLEDETPGQKVSNMLLGKSRGQLLIAPERMKQMGLSRNDAYLWMCLVGSIPKLGRSPGEGNGNPLSTLA